MKLLCDFSSTHNGDSCSNVGGSDELDNAASRFEIIDNIDTHTLPLTVCDEH